MIHRGIESAWFFLATEHIKDYTRPLGKPHIEGTSFTCYEIQDKGRDDLIGFGV